jgi:hypothetical protein
MRGASFLADHRHIIRTVAVDFQVVFPQKLVELSSVRTVQGVVPRTLSVIGSDFRAVDEVLINGVPSPDVVVLSQQSLLAQIPAVFVDQTITSVAVASRELGLSARSTLKFRLGRTPSKVSGVLRLVQLFLKLLLQTPGSDIFAKTLGGGALRGLGTTFCKEESGAIVSDFVLAVSTTQRQLIALQGRNPSLPRDERLLAAKVLAASFNRNESALLVSLELTSQAGRAAVVNVTV